MAGYEILLSKAARKQLKTLPTFVHNNIVEEITNLSLSPRPAGCVKLKGIKILIAFVLVITVSSMK